ncbi:probable pectinesterase/pectinesterase inhibitor 58 [Rutidosis leptorrhynchoides]|uniref:probable pectinesterase/pectinesterase inhibitor 58 n=1 Tax=Rutidosis leptorrhynchoides TaxID=125765 RepID=UPI003A99AEF7
MANKIITSILSSVLVVGCVLGVVTLIVNNEDSDVNINTSIKAAYNICKPTEYKEACNKAITDVAKNSSATNEDYVLAAIRATSSELQKALEKATAKNKYLGDYKQESHGELERCDKRIGYATDELKQVLRVVFETETVSLAEQIDPILVWLTAIRSYHTTCVEKIRDEKLKKDMQEGMQTSNEQTFSAQKIVYNVLGILKDFGVDLGEFEVPNTEHRRLLDEVDEMDQHRFPDRQLTKGSKGG